MKLLMVSDSYPPSIGGLGRHVHLLSRELASRGHEVIVFTVGYSDLPQFEEEDKVKVYRLSGFFQRIPFLYKDIASKKSPPTQDWLISKELRRTIKQDKPDIVHTHGWILYSMLPLKDGLKIPLVTTLHDYGFICPKTSLLKQSAVCDEPFTTKCLACGRDQYGVAKSFFTYLAIKLNRGRLKSVNKFIAVSPFVKNVHSKYLGLSDKDIVVLPNFYAPEVSGETTGASNFPEDFILFVGALIPVKGINVLIKAYQKLNTKTKLVLIGARHPDYHYESTENILVIENAPQSIVAEAYRGCRFVILPSIWPDPCPTVAFEAMSRKNAIIASRIGGFTDIVVDAKTGTLVSPNDAEGLSEAMRHLLENPEAAEKMGQKGYQRFIKNYTPNVTVPRIEHVYESLI